MKARLSLLHKTEAEWEKTNFKPEPGEVVVYDPDTSVKYARIKIGDAKRTPLNELPFIMEAVAEELLTDYLKAEELDAGRITSYLT
jgi:hypothetical protein